jgi:hypothetical protein
MVRYATVFGMESDRHALAAKLVREEMENRRLGATRVAIDSRLSRSTVSNFVNNTKPATRVTMKAIETGALDWPRGFLSAVLDGDVEWIAALDTTDTFSAYTRDMAVRELRSMAMVVPVREDDDEVRGNGR